MIRTPMFYRRHDRMTQQIYCLPKKRHIAEKIVHEKDFVKKDTKENTATNNNQTIVMLLLSDGDIPQLFLIFIFTSCNTIQYN